jgi:hypothetical protein
VTWRRVEIPSAELDSLIEAYFTDQEILSADTARLAERRPIPKGPLAGYDGRLFDWLTEMVNYGPSDGPERAWPIVLELIARAPNDAALVFVGSSAVEDLVNLHGAEFENRIVEEAATNPRLRLALQTVWAHNDVPHSLKTLIARRDEGARK